MSIWIIILIITMMVIVGLWYYTQSGENALNGADAKQLIANGCIGPVIDVRTDMEWELGHYNTAYHIPVTQINTQNEALISLLKNTINKAILVYCNTGQRARYAVEQMKKLSNDNVYFYLKGSYTELL